MTNARQSSPLHAPAFRSQAIARARLTIDLDAIAANWRALDALSGPGTETAAVVKADAYGLGAARVAPALAAAGAESFFVALAEEGAALRATLGPRPSIYLLSGLLAGDADICRYHALIPCLNSVAQARRLIQSAPDLACALQLESGMNRLGVAPSELTALGALLPQLKPRLLLSHLACADEPDHPQNPTQRKAFDDISALLPRARRSLAATGGILLGEAFHYDLVRPGIGLYGGAPFGAARPAVNLSLPVIQTRRVACGESVGYGAAWTASAPARIATVSAGYADGLVRAISGGSINLYAGDVACPLVGRVSMDLITVDVTALEDTPPFLEILNAQQGIDALAEAAGTIGYEILTRLGARYERVYKDCAQRPDSR